MSGRDLVDEIVDAVLYEGYILYPYRPSAIKNRVRWTFGGIHPRRYSEDSGGSEAWQMRTESILVPGPACQVSVELRFLHLVERIESGREPWQEATERRFHWADIALTHLRRTAVSESICLPDERTEDAGVVRRWKRVEAEVGIRAEPVEGGADRLTVEIANITPIPAGLDREQVMLHSLVSAHTIVRITGGRLLSQTNPPAEFQAAVAACRNLGTWPVLVGEVGAADTVLSSPIILEDYPRIAEESAGALFDSTEIDELLTLRILSLTDAEKAEMRATDERARLLLERTESLTGEDLMRMHGTIRGLRPAGPEQ